MHTQTRNTADSNRYFSKDEDLIMTLTAISYVTNRLAEKLKALSEQEKQTGGKTNVKD